MIERSFTCTRTGARYRFEGMNVQAELRILRRLAPFVATMIRTFVRNPGQPGGPVRFRADFDKVKLIGEALDAYGALSDSDTDLIERACLGAMSREQGDAWVPVWPEGAAGPAFADINGLVALRLMGAACGNVVEAWAEDADAFVPPEVRAIINTLH